MANVVYMSGGRVVRNAGGRTLATPGAGGGGGGGQGSISQSVLPSFFLVRSTAGSPVPFAGGHVFAKGAVPSGNTVVLNTPSYQVSPISLWDDGSVKHALVAGKANLSANVTLTVNMSFGSAQGGGTLTESSLISAAPTATVSYGTYGTVDISTLLGTSALVLTENAGSQYANFQYIANFPNDSTVRAVFYVQLWVGGSYRIRVAVENGTAESSGSSKTGTGTVTIAGTQVFSGSVSMPAAGCRWDAVGGSFSYPTLTHEAAYLRWSKMVPNFAWTNPSAGMLAAFTSSSVTQAGQNFPYGTPYSPMQAPTWPTDMGGPGFGEFIGLLPHWDAMYCTTGDTRCLNSLLEAARGFGIYPIFLRDSTTKKMPAFSNWPTAYANSESLTAGSYTWEIAHNPNAGYLAWLVTGERFFLETLQANAWANYWTQNPNGNGALRIYSSQTRGRGWRLRTIACAAATAPTGDLFGTDCRNSVKATINNWKTTHVDTNYPATGLLATNEDQEPGIAGYQRSLFEHMFIVSSLGWAWDFELGLTGGDKTNHQAVRDFSYRIPVGITGRGQPTFGEYSWRHAPGPYRSTVGPDTNPNNLYSTWDAIYDASYGDQLGSAAGLSILDSSADAGNGWSFPQGNWGHVITCLSYAIDHGTPNAQRGMNFILGASNWAANSAEYNDWPEYGVLPRVPIWYGSMVAGEGKNIGQSFMTALGKMPGIDMQGTPVGDPDGVEANSVAIYSYSGCDWNTNFHYSRTGTKRYGTTMLRCAEGGHQAYYGNESVAQWLYDSQDHQTAGPTWSRLRDAYLTPPQNLNTNPDGTPTPVHGYQTWEYCPYNNKMFRSRSIGLSPTGGSSDASFSFDCNNPTPNSGAPGPWTQLPDHPASPGTGDGATTSWDSDAKRFICVNIGQHRFAFYDPVANSWSQAASSNIMSYSDRISSCYIPTKKWFVSYSQSSGSGNEAAGLRVADMNLADPVLAFRTTSGASLGDVHYGITWDVKNGRVVFFDGTNMYYCTPPATIGGTWVINTLSFTGSAPDNINYSGRGIWGSFKYVNDGVIEGYAFNYGPNDRTWFMKL